MQKIAPVSGWALNYVVELDHFVVGVCRSFLRASAERRQVVAALLSTSPPPADPVRARELGDLVMRGDHRRILEAAFNEVPRGMRGALARSGAQPHSRPFYAKLCELLARGGACGKVIQQLASIDFERLRIVEVLPNEICAPSLVSRIRSVRTATDIGSLFGMLTAAGVDKNALADSLARVGAASDLTELWERWAMKCAFPPHPVPASDIYVPIECGVALRRMALRYRNCARRYLSQVLDQQSAFAEFHYARESAVVHLCRHRGDWVLDNVFGRDNAGVSMALRQSVISYLAQNGVSDRYYDRSRGSGWSVLRRLTRNSLLLDVDFD